MPLYLMVNYIGIQNLTTVLIQKASSLRFDPRTYSRIGTPIVWTWPPQEDFGWHNGRIYLYILCLSTDLDFAAYRTTI